MGCDPKSEILIYLTTSWTWHLHIKSYLIWTWWPVRTELTCWVTLVEE